MVFCCVPLCGSDSWTCDSNITFHEFPTNPDLAARWIQQINSAIRSKQKPMWFPRGKSHICSKHFLQTDFKDDSDTLKPRVIPSVFGHKYIGLQESERGENASTFEPNRGPLIVNLLRPKVEPGLPECQDSTNQNESVTSPTHSLINFKQEGSVKLNLDTKQVRIVRKVVQPGKNVVKTNIISKSPVILDNKGASLKQSSKISTMFVKPSSNLISKSSPCIRKIGMQYGNVGQKRKLAPKNNSKNELIEIGPNTFLKINPDIIKVNKKQTPSGNTVLQFVMDQKLARSQSAAEYFPKIIHGSTTTSAQNKIVNLEPNSVQQVVNENSNTVQHVLGHLVDTHVCKDACTELKETDEMDATEEPVPSTSDTNKDDKQKESCIDEAPVLFTTNTPLSHCLMDKPKYASQLRQKSRQISQLKFKLAKMAKKVETLEDKIIVQERQLSYTLLKRLKTIRKNANNGDSCATYILEQIRCYAGKTKMRWSDSTLSQCAIWCRKAPYAYEYFKKSEFFKLPCLGTVKRFMKKHPELKVLNKVNVQQPKDDESSSDFDFDDSDSEKEGKGNSDVEENDETKTTSETNSADATKSTQPKEQKQEKSPGNASTSNQSTATSSLPMTVDGSNLEVQELILPSGEVVQCYSSSICNGDGENQYYLIPNMDQHDGGEHEYNVVQASESLPVILQNLENAQLPQEQLIFITNSSDQMECTETEVVTASSV